MVKNTNLLSEIIQGRIKTLIGHWPHVNKQLFHSSWWESEEPTSCRYQSSSPSSQAALGETHVLPVALAVLWRSPICTVVVSNRGRAPLWEMRPNAVFAAATAAKYLIISNEHLWHCAMGSEMQISPSGNIFISFSGMATFNKMGVTITPSLSAMVPARSSHRWEGVECLEGKAVSISGRVTRLIDELNSSEFGNWIAFVSINGTDLFP